MVRILVIGHGLIGRQRAAAVASLSKSGVCTLAGTVDPEPRQADLYGSVPHHARFEDVAPAAYDAAIIAVPHHLGAPTATVVLQQGKPILIEKPLGVNAAEARAIASAGAGTDSYVGYNYRFLPTLREAYRRVRGGEIGALRSIDMLLGHGGNPRSAEGWKLQPELAGGGVILDPGVHLFDLLLQFEPSLELRHVAVSRGFWKTGIEEDVVAILARGSLLATVRISHIRWINTFRIEIGGDDGYVHIEGRGGSYGSQQARFGRRWGWNDGTGRNQRDTETLSDYGSRNDSLDVEVGAVVERWTGAKLRVDEGPGPASLADGVRIAELCDQLYAAIPRG
jgi:predicted dehydrogenase